MTWKFQSAHPVRGATYIAYNIGVPKGISIRAPRARCDIIESLILLDLQNFNPRTPCEVRLYILCIWSRILHTGRTIITRNISAIKVFYGDAQNSIREPYGIFATTARSHSENQYSFAVISWFDTDMLNALFPVISQIIKTQAVLVRVNQFNKAVFQH